MTTTSERIRARQQRLALERAYRDLIEWAQQADEQSAAAVMA